MRAEACATIVLACVVVPAWIAAGVLDWLCHRRARIEHTSGARESVLHLVMFAELGVPLVAVLLFEINALVFAIAMAGFVVHEFTAMHDVKLAVRHRPVTPIEQHVHSFLELLPLMAILLLVVLYPGQFLALFALGDEQARFELQWKQIPLPVPYTAAVLVAAVVCNALPYTEELIRGLRAPKHPRR